MRGARRSVVASMAAAAVAAAPLVACYSVLGMRELQELAVEGDDASLPPRGADGAPVDDDDPSTPEPEGEEDAASPSDAGPDRSVGEVVDAASWSSPNGAVWETNGAGTRITSYSSANHPVIHPAPQPSIPSDDYTVHAIVVSPAAGAMTREFGLVARVQANGESVVFGSEYGGQTKPFVTTFGPPNWSPVAFTGAVYTYAPGARYMMKLKVAGKGAFGKLWNAADAEPADFQVSTTAPWDTGRGVGFYTYFVNGAILERLWFTVP